MGIHGTDPVLIQDLATVYTILALKGAGDEETVHGTVGPLLSGHRPDLDRPAIDALISSAVATCRGDGGRSELVSCIQRIRDRSDASLRGRLVAEMTSVALEDGDYTHLEARFVGAVARSWDVHPDSGDHRLWSVFNPEGAAEDWTRVHDLALVYISLAHQSDDDLTQSEIDAIVRKLAEWLPAALPSDVVVILSEALEVYANGPDQELIDEAVARVREAVPPHQRDALIADLEYVARADDVVLVEERTIIERLVRAWSPDANLN